MPAFHKTAIEGYARDIVAVADAVLATWPVGQTADVADLVRDLVRCVALKCIFGLDWHAGDRGYGQSSQDVVDLLVSPLSIALPYRFPGSPYARQHPRSQARIADAHRAARSPLLAPRERPRRHPRPRATLTVPPERPRTVQSDRP